MLISNIEQELTGDATDLIEDIKNQMEEILSIMEKNDNFLHKYYKEIRLDPNATPKKLSIEDIGYIKNVEEIIDSGDAYYYDLNSEN